MTYHNSPTTTNIEQVKATISRTRREHAQELRAKLAPLYKQLHDLKRKRYIEMYGVVSEWDQKKLDKIKQKY